METPFLYNYNILRTCAQDSENLSLIKYSTQRDPVQEGGPMCGGANPEVEQRRSGGGGGRWGGGRCLHFLPPLNMPGGDMRVWSVIMW